MKASIIFALIAGTALAMPALDTRAIKQRDDPDEDHEDLCDDLTEQLDTARYYALEVQKSPSTYGQDAVESVNAKVKKALEAFQEVCLFVVLEHFLLSFLVDGVR